MFNSCFLVQPLIATHANFASITPSIVRSRVAINAINDAFSKITVGYKNSKVNGDVSS